MGIYPIQNIRSRIVGQQDARIERENEVGNMQRGAVLQRSKYLYRRPPTCTLPNGSHSPILYSETKSSIPELEKW
ncbi:hypothetical protein NQ317_007966 [Molorchus minor]|uniref:Uncharacterized protein n=1 Tax=Molorchus minor TaxID=1323400 RepID=A0ABQ9JI22_9CUCU|nr:hypothetical protein NQ317_007966 [Molorchus minor]